MKTQLNYAKYMNKIFNGRTIIYKHGKPINSLITKKIINILYL